MTAPAAGEAPETPADQAISAELSGDHAGALRFSIPLGESSIHRPIALLVTALSLHGLGKQVEGRRGLELAARAALAAGNVSLASACAVLQRRLGGDGTALGTEVARAFAKGSALLAQDGAKPPLLPSQQDPVLPLDGDRSEAELVELATELVGAARTSEFPPLRVAPHSLFSSLDQDSLTALIGILEVEVVAGGARLIEQGTTGAEAYIVARGELEVVREGEHRLLLARLGTGALIGEMALLSGAPRAASVVACRPSVVLIARKDALEQLAERAPQVVTAFAEHCRRRMVDNLLRSSTILSAVNPRDRANLIGTFVTRTYEAGERVIAQGAESDGLHLVASGEVSVVRREGDESTLLAKLGPGEVVGEVALVLRRPSGADVVATHPTVTLHLPRDGFLAVIKQHPALLAELYELAIKRDEETTSIMAQEAREADDAVLL